MIRKPHKCLALNPIYVIFKLVRCLGPGTNGLCFLNWEPKYLRLGHSPIELPKGHLAVYVRESEEEKQRVLVPVTFFNHPLLRKLLEEAEKVYGFDHPGVITIPCEISEFERIQKTIATTQGYYWKRSFDVPSRRKKVKEK
ncbi:Small auxin-up RNA [Sesbania bispinosa]|nr:Small auxin-up RNA [Sesbania bispinosa]